MSDFKAFIMYDDGTMFPKCNINSTYGLLRGPLSSLDTLYTRNSKSSKTILSHLKSFDQSD